jgi:hypothetical protein
MPKSLPGGTNLGTRCRTRAKSLRDEAGRTLEVVHLVPPLYGVWDEVLPRSAGWSVVMKDDRSMPTGWERVVLAALANVLTKRGVVYLADVQHDLTCPKPEGGRCTCTPDVVIREVPS